jgi:3-methylcrotonyl-CoA carboxylase alpha subunit
VGNALAHGELPESPESGFAFTLGAERLVARVIGVESRYDVFLRGTHYALEIEDPLAHVGEQAAAEGGIRALMPGRVVSLLAEPGSHVKKGQPLLILEAMKMEHTLRAPADGACEGFNVAVGEQVAEGAELVRFKPAEDDDASRG